MEKCLSKVRRYLIVQFQRFNQDNGTISKNAMPVQIIPDVSKILLCLDNEIHFTKHLSLKAVVNHFGSITNGHYTASVLDGVSGKWFSCNDRAVLPTSEKDLNNGFSYLLFYEVN